ncbi:MAG: hypothetical protein ABIJ65_13805 [Chloroflexota bacterium]
MTSATAFNLIHACREPGCPIWRLEQRSVERYLNNQFYENIKTIMETLARLYLNQRLLISSLKAL